MLENPVIIPKNPQCGYARGLRLTGNMLLPSLLQALCLLRQGFHSSAEPLVDFRIVVDCFYELLNVLLGVLIGACGDAPNDIQHRGLMCIDFREKRAGLSIRSSAGRPNGLNCGEERIPHQFLTQGFQLSQRFLHSLASLATERLHPSFNLGLLIRECLEKRVDIRTQLALCR